MSASAPGVIDTEATTVVAAVTPRRLIFFTSFSFSPRPMCRGTTGHTTRGNQERHFGTDI